MSAPEGATVDKSGNLYVADVNNSRVLKFTNADSKANGANADAVLGQADFTSKIPATTQSGMIYPDGVAADGLGNLYVADGHNNRVLKFTNAASKANGANADAVLGQTDFTSGAGGTTQIYLRHPSCVATNNSAGKLYVADNGNNRVLVFSASSSITSVENISQGVIPNSYSLNQNYPNPYNPLTTIEYGLPARSTIRLVIYNVLGQVVKELINSEQQAGVQTVVWNANVSSGIYFYRLEATSLDSPSKRFVETKKMLLLK
jgi:sugar lactone lactonase YvrE